MTTTDSSDESITKHTQLQEPETAGPPSTILVSSDMMEGIDSQMGMSLPVESSTLSEHRDKASNSATRPGLKDLAKVFMVSSRISAVDHEQVARVRMST
jgi:hypothetical protein